MGAARCSISLHYIYGVFCASALSEVILETAIYASLCAFTSSYLKEIDEIWNVLVNRKEDLRMAENQQILQVDLDLQRNCLGTSELSRILEPSMGISQTFAIWLYDCKIEGTHRVNPPCHLNRVRDGKGFVANKPNQPKLYLQPWHGEWCIFGSALFVCAGAHTHRQRHTHTQKNVQTLMHTWQSVCAYMHSFTFK